MEFEEKFRERHCDNMKKIHELCAYIQSLALEVGENKISREAYSLGLHALLKEREA